MVRDQQRVPVGHFWNKTDREGKKFIAGVVSLGIFGEIPVVIFEEEKIPGRENAPDYVMRTATENSRERFNGRPPLTTTKV